jgi:2,4-dienoyl-CoA reductase-like NADH-dependent reductase (Old Yellow Enzyme family)
MNERIAKLYDQAVVIEDGEDYVCGELDPFKFAELIVRECIDIVGVGGEFASRPKLVEKLQEHFGVEE